MSTVRDRKRARRIGAKMQDGSIYAGVSPDTGRPMYTTQEDVRGGFFGLKRHFNLKGAFAAALKLKAHGRTDWRVPTKAELNVLFGNRAGIGGFDMTGSDPAGWYWSSSHTYYHAWAQRFSDGNQDYNFRDTASSLRCVRG
jgi:hypothetical protein